VAESFYKASQDGQTEIESTSSPSDATISPVLQLDTDAEPPPLLRRFRSGDSSEERFMIANAALEVAFDILDFMRIRHHRREECLFRKLMEATSKCGNSSKAIQVCRTDSCVAY
jgi:hypothetical protein